MKQENPLAENPWMPLAELDPDWTEFEYLKYPPFVLDVSKFRAGSGDLHIDGYLFTLEGPAELIGDNPFFLTGLVVRIGSSA